MVRYAVLLNWTEKGVAAVKHSVARAEAFRAAAAKAGVQVEAQYWTVGGYDGLFLLNAPDDLTASAVVLQLGQAGNVRTCMLRAFDQAEFKKILAKVGP